MITEQPNPQELTLMIMTEQPKAQELRLMIITEQPKAPELRLMIITKQPKAPELVTGCKHMRVDIFSLEVNCEKIKKTSMFSVLELERFWLRLSNRTHYTLISLVPYKNDYRY